MGEGAVGIQLAPVAEAFDLGQEAGQLGLKKGLAACDAYAGKDSLALFKKGEEGFLSHGLCGSMRQDKRGIVAKGTAQIAAAEKDGAGHAARIIQQRQLLKTCNVNAHALPSMISARVMVLPTVMT
jgi:hypothetical protein